MQLGERHVCLLLASDGWLSIKHGQPHGKVMVSSNNSRWRCLD